MLTIPDHVHTLNHPDLTVACEAALQSAQIIKHAWDNQPIDFKEKDGHYDLVSIVDEKSDDAIQTIIRKAVPDDRIVSEELNPDWDESALAGRVWICDPLDGTACFLFKTDPLAPCIMIALIVDGVAVISVVVQPLVGRWTYAIRGQGAFVDGDQVCMRSRDDKDLSQGWVDLNQYGDSAFESDWFRKVDRFVRGKSGARLVTRLPPHSAIALRLLESVNNETKGRGLVACMHDHNPCKPKQLPWDIIPIKLILEEAGGAYIDVSRSFSRELDPFNLDGPILIGARPIIDYITNNA